VFSSASERRWDDPIVVLVEHDTNLLFRRLPGREPAVYNPYMDLYVG